MKKEPKQFAQTSESILARIASKIYIELGINHTAMKGLIYRFVNALNLGTESKLYYTRINLFNELVRNVMTFKVFMKAMNVIGATKIIFTVTVITHTGKEVTIVEPVNLNLLRTPDEADALDEAKPKP